VGTLLGEEYAVEKSRLKVWTRLEGVQRRLIRAIENRDKDLVASLLCSYVSIALDVDVTDAPWQEVAIAYSEIFSINRVDLSLPIFRSNPQVEESVLDYVGREWYEWAHMFAAKYGWTLEYIAQLEVVDALALMQELSVERVNNKEWDWMLSQNSRGYDKATKKEKFIHLPRPDWMKENPRGNQPRTTKIRKDLIPLGNVISWGGDRSNVEH